MTVLHDYVKRVYLNVTHDCTQPHRKLPLQESPLHSQHPEMRDLQMVLPVWGLSYSIFT